MGTTKAKNQEELIMQKKDLQTEIKALQEYRKEAESLIEKINSVTKKMESDVVCYGRGEKSGTWTFPSRRK